MWYNVDYVAGARHITSLNWMNGLVMVSILVGFSYFLIWKSRKSTRANHAKMDFVPEIPKTSLIKDVAFILIGSIGLSAGAHFLVEGTVGLASVLGISNYVISVTVVAFGTSLPELMTSVMAAFKKHADLSVGNLIGSNIFNLLGILGITSLFKTIPITEIVLKGDMIWVLGISVLIFPMMVTRKRISKAEGTVLFLMYCIYIYFTVTQN
jgi:cation:H+ antiporter